VTETIRPFSTTIVDGPRAGLPGTAISRPAWMVVGAASAAAALLAARAAARMVIFMGPTLERGPAGATAKP
jgi:hypothetical protein